MYFNSDESGRTPVLHSPATIMQCTLYIPHLIPPRELGVALWPALAAPQLKTLLARARYTHDAQADGDALLCDAFGIARQQDWPLAPLLAHAHGLAADSGYWLCATPIHLETRRTALMVADPAGLNISATEAAAIAATLAEHLGEEHLTLHAPQPGQWFLRCDTPPAMTTTSVDTVIGRDIRNALPQGADGPRWHRILTEIQMLLHAHPVNDAREARGQLPINSVWLWAGGTKPAQPATPYATVWSDDATVNALAHHGACRMEAAPPRFTLDTLVEGAHFFSLNVLAHPLREGDVQAWSSAVTALNRDWFLPLYDALKSRRVNKLIVLSGDDKSAHQFAIRPFDLLKIFNKNKYLQ